MINTVKEKNILSVTVDGARLHRKLEHLQLNLNFMKGYRIEGNVEQDKEIEDIQTIIQIFSKIVVKEVALFELSVPLLEAIDLYYSSDMKTRYENARVTEDKRLEEESKLEPEVVEKPIKREVPDAVFL